MFQMNNLFIPYESSVGESYLGSVWVQMGNIHMYQKSFFFVSVLFFKFNINVLEGLYKLLRCVQPLGELMKKSE